MRRLILILAVLLCAAPTLADTGKITFGTERAERSALLECRQMLNDENPLPNDPSSGEVATALASLVDGTYTFVHYTDTSLPNCGTFNRCKTVAETACGAVSQELTQIRLRNGRCRFGCYPTAEDQLALWGVISGCTP